MNKVFLKDCGISPNTDITLALYELFLKHRENTEFVFEDAEYFFSPKEQMRADYRISNSDVLPYRVLGLWMKNMKNCVLSGNGARLFFAGHMQPITMDHCENIKIENLIIDWKKPLVAEGVVVGFGDCYTDLYINPVAFPHRLTENWLEFDVGADEWYPLCRVSPIQFDHNNRCVTRASGDNFWVNEIEALGNSVYRMHTHQSVSVGIGNIFVLRHNYRRHAGVFCEKSKNITLADITVYSCGGLGCLAQFCENLTYRRVHFVPNTEAGRKISNGRDDGMHLTCNSGNICITECTFLGLMDDPINVHGCCVTADEVVDERTLRCRYREKQAQGFYYWAEAGDTLSFIERGSMASFATAMVKEYNLETLDTFTVSFAEPLSVEIIDLVNKGDSVALDNLTHTAAFECTNNRFGSCRARGILVSTPKPVKISNNYFASSGSAILVAGDSNGWFESGECHDVEISGNVFTDNCLSSMYQFCDGVISICPVVPKPEMDKPFHKNIYIHDNVFDTPGTPVLYGFSCRDLRFVNNRIFSSPAAPKWHPGESMIKLEFCKDADLRDNKWIGRFDIKDSVSSQNCEGVTP